jgi:hypothetical protein
MPKLSLREWSDISQVVSAAVVVASLVYVGFEIRQNTDASRAATRQSIAETDFEYVGATLDALTLVEAEAKNAVGLELTSTEHFILVERQHLNFRIFENAYYQYQAGLLEAETWDRYRWIISRQLTTNEAARAMWTRFGPGFDESFKAEVAAIRSEPFVPR